MRAWPHCGEPMNHRVPVTDYGRLQASEGGEAGIADHLPERISGALRRFFSVFLNAAMMHHWLMKSEPDEVSIDDLAASPGCDLPWFGVRNYQARNFMRDDMRPGDLALFYHSSCPQPGIAGICKVVRRAFPDATQFDTASPYFDPKSTPDKPRWHNVAVRFVRKTRLLGLDELRSDHALAGLTILKRGNRLSITPVTTHEWAHIESLLARPAPA